MNESEISAEDIPPHEYLARQHLDQLLKGTPVFDIAISDFDLGSINEISTGAHLVTPRLGYTHHGLYIGDGQVIHYSGLADGLSSGPVQQVGLEEFCSGKKFWTKEHPNATFDGESAVNRARSRLSESRYNLILNNCEHFVYWCLYDRNKSEQVDGAFRALAHAASKRVPGAAIAVAAKETTQSITAYLQGKISKEQMLEEISHTSISTASMLYYGAIGQAVIPVPILGGAIGAGIGFLVASLLNRSGVVALGSTAEVKAARKRREIIAALCQQATQHTRAVRESLQSHLSSHFEQRHENFAQAFRDMEQSLSDWNSDSFVAGLANINAQFGLEISYARFDDFYAAMSSRQPLTL